MSRDDLAVQLEHHVAGVGDLADHREIQLPFAEDRLGLGLAAGLQHHQHPLLAFREHHLVGRHAGLRGRAPGSCRAGCRRRPCDAISTEEEVRPAAPMSWMATIASDAISSRQASISNFSVNGSPTWTVGRFSSLSSEKSALTPWSRRGCRRGRSWSRHRRSDCRCPRRPNRKSCRSWRRRRSSR